RKELDNITRQVADFALLSLPSKAREITTAWSDLKQAQQMLQELAGKPQKSLKDLAGRLEALGTPTPISKGVVSWTGTAVTDKELGTAADAKRLENGKKLFTEKGCLACHSHDATTTGPAPVEGHQNFGPNLSRLSAKLHGDSGRR